MSSFFHQNPGFGFIHETIGLFEGIKISLSTLAATCSNYLRHDAVIASWKSGSSSSAKKNFFGDPRKGHCSEPLAAQLGYSNEAVNCCWCLKWLANFCQVYLSF